MKRKPGARELELRAASVVAKKLRTVQPSGEAMAMLLRRGLKPERTSADLLFPEELDDEIAERFAVWLRHYAFRLFLRGAMLNPQGFLPAETTRYVGPRLKTKYAEVLVALGLAEKQEGLYRLKRQAKSFGATLEWYIGRELAKRFGFDVATGVKLHVPGIGGDLDVVAAAEGKLIYLELKSSPPRNISVAEISAFCGRVKLVRPDIVLFVVDTALRLSDKILPMFMEEFERRGLDACGKIRIAGQLWALTPRFYLVNGSRDLVANIGKAIAAGFRALSPGIL